ncbi:hypothetical protein F5Y14DRAFT_397166 [Nemania sp. NC0429]|nr:hypothetical protein F5Y14DRAFT_397166 [Nemania sp. NC0429]
MASIGPSLPPHLAKRKRTPEDESSSDSPPAKIRASESAQINRDEIGLESDSDSDDGYGPSAPVVPTTRQSIGPSLPPSIGPTPPPPPTVSTQPRASQNRKSAAALESEDDRTSRPLAQPQSPTNITTTTTATRPSLGPAAPQANTDEIRLDSEDEDDVGPAPPEPKRIHGPAPPPAALSERPPAAPDSETSDSDDDYGPALASSTSHQQRQARARALEAAEAEAAASRGPKRDDWMLAPPTADGYRAADPTKLKARRFNSGPRASASGSGGGGGGGSEISSIWTETPEEKRKRLENAVLGRDTGSASANPHRSSHVPSKAGTKEAAAEQTARIQSFTEATRGRSLYDEHQAARASRDPGNNSKGATSSSAKKSWVDEEDDDPSKRAFDREKDMKLGGRIGASQRRELLNKAADFGGRFAKGKYL